jgi:hypothetical protein
MMHGRVVNAMERTRMGFPAISALYALIPSVVAVVIDMIARSNHKGDVSVSITLGEGWRDRARFVLICFPFG